MAKIKFWLHNPLIIYSVTLFLFTHNSIIPVSNSIPTSHCLAHYSTWLWPLKPQEKKDCTGRYRACSSHLEERETARGIYTMDRGAWWGYIPERGKVGHSWATEHTHSTLIKREGGCLVSEVYFCSEHVAFTDAACCEVTLRWWWPRKRLQTEKG